MNRFQYFTIYNEKEKNLKKESAAKIVSLAAFLHIDAPLFFRPKELSHFVYLCMWIATDDEPQYDYLKKCRDATKSHPYISRYLGNRIEVILSKAIQSQLYT